MRANRVIGATLLLLSAGFGLVPAANAQSEEEVREAEEALETARLEVEVAEGRLVEADVLLLDAVADYQQLEAELHHTAFELAEVQEEMLEREAEVAQLRERSRQLVAGLYVDVVVGGPLAPLTTTTVTEAMLTRDLLQRVAQMRLNVAGSYQAGRADLVRRRADLESIRDRVTLLRGEADVRVNRLVDLANAAVFAFNDATDGERQAEERREVAVERLEAAIRSVSPTALRWRPLVQRYFPASLAWPALQVLDCESRGDPTARNDLFGAVGLFQFLEGTWAYASVGAGFEGAERTNPEANIAAAAWLVRHAELVEHPRGQWGPWACQPLDSR